VFDLIFSIFLVLVFTATGFSLIKRRFAWQKSLLLAFLVSFALGYGIYGTAVFILGILGLIKFGYFFILLMIGSFLIILEFKFLKDFFGRALSAFQNSKFCRFLAFVGLSTALSFLLNTFSSLAPISSMDSVVYHFTLPKMYLQAGKIYNMEGYFFAHLPQMTEMINLFAMGLRSDISAALINSYFGIFCALLIFSIVRRLFDFRLGVLSGALFYMTPLVTWEATGNYPELHLAFFSILSFYMMYLYFEKKSIFILLLSGIFLGFGFQTKQFAFNFMLIITLLIFISFWKNKESRLSSIKKYSLWVLTVIAIGSPWHLFNYFTTGNPFFPLLYDIFGGKGWNAETNAFLMDYLSESFGYGKSLLSFILLPFALTFKGQGFHGGRLFGPLVLVFAPFAFIDGKILKRTLLILFFSLIYILIWFHGSQQTRFLIPILPFLLILVSIGIVNLEKLSSRLVNIFLRAVLIIFILFSLRTTLVNSMKYEGVVFGFENRDQFLGKMVWDYKDTQWMNNNLPNGSKVLFSGFGQYYLDVPYVLGAYGLEGNLDYSQSADKFYKSLKSAKITHIYRFNAYDFIPNLPFGEDLTDRYLEKIYEDKRIVESSRSLSLRGRELVGTVYRLK